MASVTMTLRVHEEATEGLLKGIPSGVHKVTLPLSKLAFIDTTGGTYTLGGTFTKENFVQSVKEDEEHDFIHYSNIEIIGD